MSDQSLASQTAEWIVAQLAAIEWFTADKKGDVSLYRGSLRVDGERVLEEFLGATRNVSARVVFTGHRAESLEEGQARYEATYSIMLAVINKRPGAALWGETHGGAEPETQPGLCLLRDVIRNALHDQAPGKTANGFHADRCAMGDLGLVFERRDAMLFQVDVIVIESPAAG